MRSQHLTKKIKDKSGLHGVVTFTTYEIVGVRAQEIDRELGAAVDMDPARYEALIAELNSICKKRTVVKENIVVLGGRAAFAQRLIGDLTYTGVVNYGALGTDDTTPDAADVDLGAEVARKLFARRSRTNAQASFDFFYSKADTDGTYEEFGLIIDGTATLDSGLLFNHVLTGGWTKTDQEAMTVQVQININQS